ncbi:hypothetical protein NDU88_000794 [Pleurodeles waltl]|uniref:Uncharacterized protein n=1 Tax=Pleurodeles waltl TaxID=8319 RepID=A0AAV7N958_PLEWA|nr:hypothetical protein NDU88_000794 [Pleurodeles waltl]
MVAVYSVLNLSPDLLLPGPVWHRPGAALRRPTGGLTGAGARCSHGIRPRSRYIKRKALIYKETGSDVQGDGSQYIKRRILIYKEKGPDV